MDSDLIRRVVARYVAAKSPWGPFGKKLKWLSEGPGKFWARFNTDDKRQYTHKYHIRQRGTGEWIVELETPDGTKSVDAARNPNTAKQLAQTHMEKLVSSEK
jgi:hypothetical protein